MLHLVETDSAKDAKDAKIAKVEAPKPVKEAPAPSPKPHLDESSKLVHLPKAVTPKAPEPKPVEPKAAPKHAIEPKKDAPKSHMSVAPPQAHPEQHELDLHVVDPLFHEPVHVLPPVVHTPIPVPAPSHMRVDPGTLHEHEFKEHIAAVHEIDHQVLARI